MKSEQKGRLFIPVICFFVRPYTVCLRIEIICYALIPHKPNYLLLARLNKYEEVNITEPATISPIAMQVVTGSHTNIEL